MPKPRQTVERDGTTFYLCTKCKNFKEENCFEYRSDYHRLRSWCKECRKDESLYYHRTARLRMSHQEALFSIEEAKKWKTDPLISLKRYLLHLAKNSARNRNILFNLTLDDISIPNKCPLLECSFDQTSVLYTYSIDRIDNKKGYIKGNIQIISRLANLMKNAATNEELLIFSKNIQNYIKR